MAQVTYQAPAIHCEGCAQSIQRSLGKLPGVEAVKVDVAAQQIQVSYDAAATDEPAIRARLAAAGFPTTPASA